MNKNNIIGVLLLGAIFITWSILLKPSKEEIQEKQRVQDSISAVNQANYLRQDSINKSKITLADESKITEAQNVNSPGSQELLASVDKSKYSVFANSAVGEEKITTIDQLVEYVDSLQEKK